MSLVLDLASMPRLSRNTQKEKKKTCIPGDKLFKIAEGYRSGFGTYQERGYIIASICGYVCVVQSKSDDSKENEKTVEVQQSEEGKSYNMPVIGTICTARVVSISSKVAKCAIFCVEDSVLPCEFSATLRKEDMKNVDYGKIVVWEYVKPGDIILARILGVGDVQTSYLLSIAENELGVVSALGDNGELMNMHTLHLVRSRSGYEEPRKVAHVPSMNK